VSVCPAGELWKTADWIWMPFEVVIGVGQGKGVLGRWRSSKGKWQFWGKCDGVSYCKQMGTLCRSYSLP